MHSNHSTILIYLFCCCIFSCSKKKASKNKPSVSIEQINGRYSLTKNGKVFNIKGAAGYTNFTALKQAGGNTVRIWDTTHVDRILKEANENGISVIVGIPIPESRHRSYYDDKEKVHNDFKKIKSLVNRLKSNPALLMWCVGNELVFPNKPSFYNFYKSFNTIVDMIHTDDPNHPTTTTMVNFQKNDIINIKTRTDIDIISFNIFSRINELEGDLKSFSWFWDGPYLITEWAIDGPWQEHAKTYWDAKIEPTSTAKAKLYLDRYKRFMPVKDPRFLGSFIFFWGQKQESTHTWFSLFDELGNKTEAVYKAEQIWKGKPVTYNGPEINKISISNKLASANILLSPNQLQDAHIDFAGDSVNLTIKWEVYPEDWFKKENINNLIKPDSIKGLIVAKRGFDLKFKSPKTEGPYRLFSTITDNKGNIANANIPFYVINNAK